MADRKKAWDPTGPLSSLQGAKITNHEDARCGRVANMLNGWESSEKGVDWLIELFRSDAMIDQATRIAIADALERKSGLRLMLVGANGTPTSGTKRLRKQHEYQEIADDVLARIAEGEVEKNAKTDVARDRNIGIRKVANALAYRRGAGRTFTITKLDAPDD